MRKKPRPWSSSSRSKLSWGPSDGRAKLAESRRAKASKATSPAATCGAAAASSSASCARPSSRIQSLRLAISGPNQASGPLCSRGSSRPFIETVGALLGHRRNPEDLAELIVGDEEATVRGHLDVGRPAVRLGAAVVVVGRGQEVAGRWIESDRDDPGAAPGAEGAMQPDHDLAGPGGWEL